jgi:cytochrome c oxidase subunit 3
MAFLVNKYFEWGEHIKEHIYPGSGVLALRGQGDVLFYGLYFFMTGLHALHIIIGLVFIAVIAVKIYRDKIGYDNFVQLENSGLYWHLVDLIWIFLFPLFYLIT